MMTSSLFWSQGSTCDVRVKNGAAYQGIFKTLSSQVKIETRLLHCLLPHIVHPAPLLPRQCELAVDAVHKQSDGDGGGGEEGGGSSQSPPPKIEDITDTMIFSPTDLVTMTCRDVDLNFAVKGDKTNAFIILLLYIYK